MGSIRLSTGSRPRSQVRLPSRLPGIKVTFGAADGKGALCEAVVAIGGVLSHLFDPVNARQRLIGFFRYVYDAPPPGGVFVFDIVQSGQVPPGTTTPGVLRRSGLRGARLAGGGHGAGNANALDLQLPGGRGENEGLRKRYKYTHARATRGRDHKGASA